VQQLGEFGADVLRIVGLVTIFCGCIWAAVKIVDKFWPNLGENAGCFVTAAIWAALFAAAIAVFGPALHLLQSYSCRSANSFEDCMDPPERPDPM
jgi:hypothetical protein